MPYAITFVTENRYPYFKNEILCELFLLELEILTTIRKCKIFNFVALYDHIHLLIQSDKESDISKDMHYLKRHFSRNANILLQINPNIVGEDGHPRLILQKINQFIAKNMNNQSLKNIPKFKWQISFRDHYICNNYDFKNQMNYINTNHIKHNLPDDWQYVGYNYPNLLTN